MPAIGLGQVEVIAFQEVSCPVGITELTRGKGRDRWRIVAGKGKGEWRGRMVAVHARLGKVVGKELGDDWLGVCVQTAEGKMGVLDVHLPPKATIAETGARVTSWTGVQAVKQTRKILLGDLNETFVLEESIRLQEDLLKHKTARGAILLQWLSDMKMHAPRQDIADPTYHPYNRMRQPRRLDYVFTANLHQEPEGRVHRLRHLVSSDHDALTVCVRIQREEKGTGIERSAPSHGARQLKGEEEVKELLRESRSWRGDRLDQLQRVAKSVTEPRRNPLKYVESREIKQLRSRATRQRHTPEARVLWKQLWKLKKLRKAAWEREMLQEVLKNNWHALQAVKRSRKKALWTGNLTSEEGWQKRMKQHFESIFKTHEWRGSAAADRMYMEETGETMRTIHGRGIGKSNGEVESRY